MEDVREDLISNMYITIYKYGSGTRVFPHVCCIYLCKYLWVCFCLIGTFAYELAYCASAHPSSPNLFLRYT